MRTTIKKRLVLIVAFLALTLPVGACVLVMGVTYAAVNIWPSVGAASVDRLRGIFGDQAVAQFEDLVLNTQDGAKRFAYQLDKNGTKVGWGSGAAPTVVAEDWMPPQATVLGGKKDEAVWQPFINAGGRVLAYRTFLAPDPLRPYAYAAIIAFDVQHTRLHFLLGTEEPKSDIPVIRTGHIPANDRQAGRLLAAFNGGFKAEHGHFGVMVNGVVVIPAQAGMGTIGLYDDGTLRLGLLGKDVPLSGHLLAWRQNGPLIIQDGQINPLTGSSDPKDWGYVVGEQTATYRSALGLSPDGRTLYYVVGPDLTLPALARALEAAGVYQAIQLDINNYWAHFSSFVPTDNGIEAVPLLDFMKGVDDQRFLRNYIRDYFYVTTK